jgi:hypothetical protein
VLAAAAAPAAAQGVVAPEEFEARSLGRTLYFSLSGEPFGAEQYLPGRRSLWRFRGGACVEGSWVARGEALCFTYDGEAGSHCWRLRDGPEGLSAYLVEGGAEAGLRLDLDRVDTAPLPCPGRDLTS